MINIDDLLGVPYKHCGRDKSGMDCIGLVIEVEKRFGNEIPDSENFKKSKSLSEFEALTKITAEKLSKLRQIEKPQNEGDVILFMNNRGVLHHIGCYLGSGQFIHCNKYGVHVERLTYFKEKVGRVYTWL